MKNTSNCLSKKKLIPSSIIIKYFHYFYIPFTAIVLIFAKTEIKMAQYGDGVLLIAVLLTLGCVYWFPKMLPDEKCVLFFKWQNKTAIVLISLWCAFAVSAFPLFYINDIPQFKLSSVLIYLLITVWFIPVSYTVLYSFELFSLKIKTNPELKYSNLKAYIIFFFLNFIPLAFLTLGYWPGNFSSDGAAMWSSVVGISPLNDVFSATILLIMRLCYKIYPYPYSVVVLQGICFSALITTILVRLYKQGWSFRLLAVFAFIIPFNPHVYGMISIIKVTFFHIAVLWFVYLVIVQWQDPQSFYKSPKNIIAFGLSAAAIYLSRNTGITILLPILISLVCLIRVMHIKHMIRPLLSLLSAVVVVVIIKGPVFTLMNVQKDTSSEAALSKLPLHPLLSLYVTNQYLPDDLLEIMDDILPLEYWEARYTRNNSDSFNWGDPPPESDFTNMEALALYLRIFKMYPAQVISDRLDGVNHFWNIVDPDWVWLPVEGNWVYGWFIEQHSDWVKPEWVVHNNYFNYSDNPLRPLPELLRSISYESVILRSVIWMNGLYLCLSFFLLFYNAVKKRTGLVISVIALFTTAAPYAVIQHWPHTEYTWFYKICTIAILAFSIMPVKEALNENSGNNPRLQ